MTRPLALYNIKDIWKNKLYPEMQPQNSACKTCKLPTTHLPTMHWPRFALLKLSLSWEIRGRCFRQHHQLTQLPPGCWCLFIALLASMPSHRQRCCLGGLYMLTLPVLECGMVGREYSFLLRCCLWSWQGLGNKVKIWILMLGLDKNVG